MSFIVHDDDFLAVLGDSASLELVLEVDAHEGPVYVASEDALYFTSLPRRVDVPVPGTPDVAIRRLQLEGTKFPLASDALSVVRQPSGAANGMVLGLDGRLIVCEQGSLVDAAAITAVDRVSGEREVLVDSWRGLPLNSPNDVVVASDGAIWFTDPTYGHLQGFRPRTQTGDLVYRLDPTGRLSVVADDLDKPNGLAFSPGGTVLYIGDSGAIHGPGDFDPSRPRHVLAYDVLGARLGSRRLHCAVSPGFPDGIKVDAAGRLYAAVASGVLVHDLAGELIGEISIAGAVNLTFGGPDGNVLFVTTDTALWAAVLSVTP